MLQTFYPGEYLESVYAIDFEKLWQEGCRGLIFDIDNTLVPHDAPADKLVEALFGRLKKTGFSCCLLSNNKEQRVRQFNRNLQVDYIHKAGKPRTGSYKKAMELLGTDTSNTLFIGDQIFTDVWGANLAGIPTILVKPLDPREELQIILKRYPERVVLYFYEKKLKKEARKPGKQKPSRGRRKK